MLNRYSFLSWLRRGITTQIAASEGLRAKADVTLKLTAEGIVPMLGVPVSAADSVDVELSGIPLYGPGDVVGIQEKAIIRTEPRREANNFEANYLPYVDFYDEDFPWRFSPVLPVPDKGRGRLDPWIALIVLTEDEFKEGTNMRGRPLPYIKWVNIGALPPLSEAWAWAHVHVNKSLFEGDLISDNSADSLESLDDLLKEDPDRAYARLLCPRRLQPNTTYHAFIVPAFESGRLAGLGYDPQTELIDKESPPADPFALKAWGENGYNPPEAQCLPYYYRWRFRTAALGDFEYLVRLLEPRPMPNEVGRRDMDVSEPGYGLPRIEFKDPEKDTGEMTDVLRLGGALQVPYETMPEDERRMADAYDQWAQPYPHDFQYQLARFLNLGSAYGDMDVAEANQRLAPHELIADEEQDPLITPPLYGKWHAGIDRLLHQELIEPEAAIQAAAFSPLGRLLVTGGGDGRARLWNARGKLLRAFPTNPLEEYTGLAALSAVAFLPGGQHVATGDEAGRLSVWGLDKTDAPVRQFASGTSKITCIATTVEGGVPYLLAGSEDGYARLWNAVSGELIKKMGPYGEPVTAVAFQCKTFGGLIAAGKIVKSPSFTSDEEDLLPIEAHAPVCSVACGVHNGMRFILTGEGDGYAHLWNTNGSLVKEFPHDDTAGAPVVEVRVQAGADGTFFSTASPAPQIEKGKCPPTVKLWKWPGKEEKVQPLATFRSPAQASKSRGIVTSPNGLFFFTEQSENRGHWWFIGPNWVHELNLDPRYRVAAGYGADVVRRHQEEYMKAAWEQVGQIREANRLLRRGRLARQVSNTWHRRLQALGDTDTQLRLTAPVLRRMAIDHGQDGDLAAGLGVTSGKRGLPFIFQERALPPALLSTTARRLLRPRGRIGRRMGAMGNQLISAVANGNAKIGLSKSKPPMSGGLTSKPGGSEQPNTINDWGKKPNRLQQITNKVLQAIDPEKTIPARLLARISRPERFQAAEGSDVLSDILAYPEFNQPMYEPLTAASSDRFLPNVHRIPNNTVSLLETNQKFIESYLVGLNHEFARELLWREFPTDQRGSYFRQFWDVSGALLPEDELEDINNDLTAKHADTLSEMTDEEEKAVYLQPYLEEAIREKLKDIPEIHLWKRFSTLGTHDHREKPEEGEVEKDENELVLVIRGELLKRYPNAVIYAQKAEWAEEKQEGENVFRRELSSIEPDVIKLPLYEAKIEPDIYLFGFDLTDSIARGTPFVKPPETEAEKGDYDPGWFFIIEERPGEPRFGLDIGSSEDSNGDINDWNDLSWIKLGVDNNKFLGANKTVASPDGIKVKWQKDEVNAAHLAHILFQVPVRVAVHASEMLPEQGS